MNENVSVISADNSLMETSCIQVKSVTSNFNMGERLCDIPTNNISSQSLCIQTQSMHVEQSQIPADSHLLQSFCGLPKNVDNKMSDIPASNASLQSSSIQTENINKPDEISATNTSLQSSYIQTENINKSNEISASGSLQTSFSEEQSVNGKESEVSASSNSSQPSGSVWNPFPPFQIFNCPICRKSFNSEKRLQKHITLHMEEKLQECNICKKSFSQAYLDKHMAIHYKEKTHQCPVCGKYFHSLERVEKHVTTHKKGRPHECPTCGKTFTHKYRLEIHEKIHTNEKPFECNMCNKTFNRKSNLTQHVLMHTIEKEHKCDVCLKSFFRRCDLERHLLTHTGEKPFPCPICNKPFSQKGHLNQHLLLHTGERPNQCPICNKGFYRITHLNAHIENHNKHHKCSVCNEMFPKKSILNHHLLSHFPPGKVPFKDLGMNHTSVSPNELPVLEEGQVVYPDTSLAESQQIYNVDEANANMLFRHQQMVYLNMLSHYRQMNEKNLNIQPVLEQQDSSLSNSELSECGTISHSNANVFQVFEEQELPSNDYSTNLVTENETMSNGSVVKKPLSSNQAAYCLVEDEINSNKSLGPAEPKLSSSLKPAESECNHRNESYLNVLQEELVNNNSQS